MSEDLIAKINQAADKQMELSERAGDVYYSQADRVIANAAALVAISGTESLLKKIQLDSSTPPEPSRTPIQPAT